MRSFTHDREYQHLYSEIQSSSYQNLLRRHPDLDGFSSWEEVRVVLHDQKSDPSQVDQILLAILSTHQRDHDHRWRTVLMVMFWPYLESLFSRKGRYGPDHDSLWSSIHWVFLEVLCRLDVRKRSHNLASKIANDTLHDLHRHYKATWKQAKCEQPFESELPEECFGNQTNLGFGLIEVEDEVGNRIHRLQCYLRQGVISDTAYLILLGTSIYQDSLTEYACDTGIDYQAAKKMRQRAEKAICRRENNPDFFKFNVPSSTPTPPYVGMGLTHKPYN